MWMMYRCGWCTKKNQERVLAVWITRDGFDKILSKAVSSDADKGLRMRMREKVRPQWDPDHDPSGAPQKREIYSYIGLRAEVSANQILLWLACTYNYIKIPYIFFATYNNKRGFKIQFGLCSIKFH